MYCHVLLTLDQIYLNPQLCLICFLEMEWRYHSTYILYVQPPGAAGFFVYPSRSRSPPCSPTRTYPVTVFVLLLCCLCWDFLCCNLWNFKLHHPPSHHSIPSQLYGPSSTSAPCYQLHPISTFARLLRACRALVLAR